MAAEHPAATERRDCANASPHSAHEWAWDGGKMWCAGRSVASLSERAQTPLPPCPWCGGNLDQRDDEPVICENGCEKHPTLGPLGTREELWDGWQDHLSRRDAS